MYSFLNHWKDKTNQFIVQQFVLIINLLPVFPFFSLTSLFTTNISIVILTDDTT